MSENQFPEKNPENGPSKEGGISGISALLLASIGIAYAVFIGFKVQEIYSSSNSVIEAAFRLSGGFIFP